MTNLNNRRSLICQYRNTSDRLQIVRVSNPKWWVEKIVYPGQAIDLIADKDDWVEICTYSLVTAYIEERIEAKRLASPDR
ncbi:MAG: DUF1830 domain-containing protein [Hydrococcus sp. Prado102]|nr:DUF1830 domain-containing protein [Hydrococcus sp. Prado102]